MTAVLDTVPAITDPPDEFTAQPPDPSERPNDSACSHCSNPATLRYTGHSPEEALRAAGREPCLFPKPFQLCIGCYMAWFRYYTIKWYRDHFVECGYCGAQGDTFEALMPFDNI